MAGWGGAWAAVVLGLGLAGPALAQASVGERLTGLQARLLDPAQQFSISATLEQLDAMQAETAPGTVERGRAEYLRGLVLWKAERFEEAMQQDQAALAIDGVQPFLTGSERLHLNYNLGQMAEDAEQYGVAIDAYQRALALVGADPDVDAAQRLGVQESLAFCLHEAGRFEEARRLNQGTLEAEAKLAGPESIKLAVVLNNLAQNQHALKDAAGARTTLDRLLQIATRAKDGARVDTALFQLGVRAFEGGQMDEARRLLARRLQLAQASRDTRRVAKAQADLDVLEEKLRQAAQ